MARQGNKSGLHTQLCETFVFLISSDAAQYFFSCKNRARGLIPVAWQPCCTEQCLQGLLS